METNQLIQQLADGAQPVRRLPAPWRRAALWLAISLPYAAAIVLLRSMHVTAADPLADWQFLIEESAIVLTALTAAIAAFCSVVPGHGRAILMLPLVPLAVWLATLGDACAQEWLRLGADSLKLRIDWDCLPPAAMIGVLPAIAIVVMLRRGAPLHPRATTALAALAVAALVNVVLRIYHVGDVSIMVLVWHFGGVLLFSLLAGWAGTLVLSWKRMTPVAAKSAG